MDNVQNDDNWQALIRFLPNGWEEKAIELQAISRFRNIPSVQTLLQILLIHLAEGCSLRETATRAEQGRLAKVSDVALLKRLKASGEWLKWIACSLLENLGGTTQKPNWLRKYNVRIFDASVITEPGSTGTDWRLHYSLELFGLTCDYLEVSSPQKGEKLTNFPIHKGDLIIADRAYGYSTGLSHVIDHGGDFIIRLKNKAITLKNKDGSTFQLLNNLQNLSLGEFGDWEVYFNLSNKRRQRVRLIAIKKSPEAAENSIKRAKKEMSKRQRTLDPETMELHKYFFLITSVSSKALSASQLFQLYRMRWQIELAFKRLKSILGLGHLPKTDPESAKAWLYGKLVVALLADKIVNAGRDFSPWGYPIIDA